MPEEWIALSAELNRVGDMFDSSVATTLEQVPVQYSTDSTVQYSLTYCTVQYSPNYSTVQYSPTYSNVVIMTPLTTSVCVFHGASPRCFRPAFNSAQHGSLYHANIVRMPSQLHPNTMPIS